MEKGERNTIAVPFGDKRRSMSGSVNTNGADKASEYVSKRSELHELTRKFNCYYYGGKNCNVDLKHA